MRTHALRAWIQKRLKWRVFSRPRIISMSVFAPSLRHLATLTAAGIALHDALRLTTDIATNRTVKRLLQEGMDSVQSGHLLAISWKNQIPIDLFETVQAGEASGEFSVALTRYLHYHDQRQHLRQKFRKTSSYPALLFGLTIIVIGILQTQVLPMYSRMSKELGLASTSHGFGAAQILYLLPIMVVVLALVSLGTSFLLSTIHRRRLRGEAVSIHIDKWIRVWMWLQTERSFAQLHLLLRAGLPLFDALDFLTLSAQTTALRHAYKYCREKLQRGDTLRVSFGHMMDRTSLELFQISAVTGDLVEASRRVHEYVSFRLDELMNRIETWFGPTLTIFMGGIVGTAMYAVFVPMYTFISSISSSTGGLTR